MAEENVVVIKEGKKSKLPFLIVIILLLILLLLILLGAAILKKKKEKKTQKDINIEKIVKKLEKKNIPKDALSSLIQKATILYKQGQKEKALEILNKLSKFSKSLSFYNLGVIKLEEKNYKKAIEYFQKAIISQDNKVLSAINAAYASLMINDYKLFNYYRNLAYTFLPEIAKNKNFPYYYAVVMYYMGYEYNAIPALKTKTAFKQESNKLLSNIYEYLNDSTNAQNYATDPLYKGLNLARIGEYSFARNNLLKSNSPIGEFALGLVDLKLSLFKEASKIFNKYKNNNLYPITVFLKKSLFDIKTAQKEFKKNFLKKKEDYYDLFFYFSPYKVFNIKQTISYLKKGIAGLPLGAVEEAQNYLFKSAVYSDLNIKLSKAIKLALDGHIYLANKAFKKLLKDSNSYILHYDIGLTYAQLGDYSNAYKHFLRAYHLNPYDLKTGIFALYSGAKTGIDNPHLVALIKEDITDKTILEDAMLSIYTNNTVKIAAFIQKEEKNNPLWLITKIVSKSVFNKDYSYEALKLKSIFEKDLIANLLYFYANNKDLTVKKLAQNYQGFFLQLNRYANLNDFFYGAKIAKEWYFSFAKISGLLNRVRLILLKKAQTETQDMVPVLKRLAYANLYTKHFEEAFTIYNDLINNKNITDPHTLYHAAVAAIGANHHPNAVALMELAKLKNPNYFEARYGLGLLWQESNNLNAASIQYGKIKDGFESKFFDFNIKPKN